jgi:hypothetical protein
MKRQTFVAGQGVGLSPGPNGRPVERFVSVYVADAGDKGLIEQ